MRRFLVVGIVSLVGCGGWTPSAPPKLFAVEEGMKQAPFWSSTVPQREDVAKLFDSASPYKGDLEKGVLFCRYNFPKTLTINGRFITREARLDPVVGVEGPDGKYLRYRFGFNEREVFLSLPLMDLKKSELWQMHIYDQGRLARDNWVATLKSNYKGELPFLFSQEDPKITAECRGLEKSSADKLAEGEAKALSQGVKEAKGALSIRKVAADGGYSDSPLPTLCKGTEQLAALVGWQDPKLVEPIKEVNEAISEWGKQLKSSLSTLSEVASFNEASLQVKMIYENAQQSTITLKWENKGSDDYEIFAKLSWLDTSCTMSPPVADSTTNPVTTTLIKAGETRAISYNDLSLCGAKKRELEVPRLLFFEVKKGETMIESQLFWIP